LFAVEGPNEPSISTFTCPDGVNSGNSWQGVAAWQSGWYAAVHADPTLSAAGIPVTTPTLVGAEPDNWGLQFLTVPTPQPGGENSAAGTKFADIYNDHVYPMFGGAAQTIDPVKAIILSPSYLPILLPPLCNGFAGSLLSNVMAATRIITEFGYPATGGSPGGVSTDIRTQGVEIITGLMNAWTEGYAAICIYTFYDQGDGFGVFNGPGNPKASATIP
jgi:hypothetical protein